MLRAAINLLPTVASCLRERAATAAFGLGAEQGGSDGVELEGEERDRCERLRRWTITAKNLATYFGL